MSRVSAQGGKDREKLKPVTDHTGAMPGLISVGQSRIQTSAGTLSRSIIRLAWRTDSSSGPSTSNSWCSSSLRSVRCCRASPAIALS